MNDRLVTTQQQGLDPVKLAQGLVQTARHAALSTVDSRTGWPFASRVALGTDRQGAPILLIARLAQHTTNLLADARCAILIGELEEGDPMAQPRLTLSGTVQLVADGDLVQVRDRFLELAPEAVLYAGLPDFRFYRLKITSGFLNAGFGKSALLSPEQCRPVTTPDWKDAASVKLDRPVPRTQS